MRLAALVTLAVLSAIWLTDRLLPLPSPYQGNRFSQVVVASNGEPLRAFADANGVWRQPTTPSQVSPVYLEALLQYEDKYFYQHGGINPFALARAGWQWLRYGRIVSGGSTLTMQVARLLTPHQRSPLGKLYQILRAFQLEWHYSKQEILTLYLNLAPFGGAYEGVESASYRYFGKSAANLSRAEAALLAIMPQAPSRYRPDRYPERARQARDKLVQRLVDDGVWPADAITEVAMEPVLVQSQFRPMWAPLLARKLVNQHPHQPLIKTTIELPLQQALQQLAVDYLSQYPKYTGLAMMVWDNQAHAVVGYLGSGEFGSEQRLGYVDMAQANRSPGSALKPFIYGHAIDLGLIHSESLLVDAPRLFSAYRPANFSGGFVGPVSASDALTRSLNVPAVELLANISPTRFYTWLSNAGARLTLQEQPGLPLALGAAGINLEQLVTLFAALSSQGQLYQPRYQAEQPVKNRQLLSPEAAWISYEILRSQQRPDQPFSSDVTGKRNNLAWKTGTSYGHRDMWAIGTTPKYTIGVWVGRPDGTPMPGHYGAKTATPLLMRVSRLLDDDSSPPLALEKVAKTNICWPLGLAQSATPPTLCYQQRQSWHIRGQLPPTLLSVDDNSEPLRQQVWFTEKGKATMQRCEDAVSSESVALWPRLAESWVPKSQRRAQLLPDKQCDEQPISRAIDITYPRAGSRLQITGASEPLVINAKVLGSGVKYWYINGTLTASGSENQQMISLSRLGQQQLLVLDDHGNSSISQFELIE
ncbi:penicillin-binding protein 1C [Corallincola platygyrae]|uniref:peptidoglycan glycosyltransferase n=1 Tax=Corallincola platygyrae TaxID=1193278 RepID=A0ABW4XN05_9GAMM